MDVEFEKIIDEYLNIDPPLDFKQTETFYLRHKTYLDNSFPKRKEYFDMYRDILSSIGISYSIAQKYEVGVPLIKKSLKLGNDNNVTKNWLVMSYLNRDKNLTAYFYYLKVKPRFDTKELKEVSRILKNKFQRKVLNLLQYVILTIFGCLVAYEFIVGDIKILWLSTLKDIFFIYSIVVSLNYAYQYLKFKIKNKNS